jgi:beta-N-acetylhexosaminidase
MAGAGSKARAAYHSISATINEFGTFGTKGPVDDADGQKNPNDAHYRNPLKGPAPSERIRDMAKNPPGQTNEHAGELLFIGIDGTEAGGETRDLLQEVRPGGVILFRRNVRSLAGVAELCAGIRECLDPPPLIAIDEEGGRVTRLAPHVEGLPAAFTTSSAGLAELSDYWRRYGALLGAIGVDIDFAPVVDICAFDAPNGIADRSFGTDPAQVTTRGAAVMEALRASGVLPTLKHFPGLGSTVLDSHHHLPTIRKRREQFEDEDLAPFKELCGRAPAVMIGHGNYPFYSGASPVAATLSREIGTRLLRERMGFAGAAISDDLEMKAVAARVAWEDLAPRVLEAGSDMVLICHRRDRILAARQAVDRRIGSDPAFAARCREAAGRVAALRHEAGRARREAAPALPSVPDPAGIESARTALQDCASALGGTAA